MTSATQRTEPAEHAIRAIRSWLRLERAFAAFNRGLRATVGLTDARRRVVELTDGGRRALRAALLAGPVRLRSVDTDPARLATLADALDDAVELFGLQRWAPR
jgi:hypothetical protein